MLKEPSSRGVLTKEKRNALIVIAILAVLFFSVDRIFFEHKTFQPSHPMLIIHKGSETIQIDITGWDLAKIDSFNKTLLSPRTPEDDSMYKAYGLDELDSLMNEPTSPLVDSLFVE